MRLSCRRALLQGAAASRFTGGRVLSWALSIACLYVAICSLMPSCGDGQDGSLSVFASGCAVPAVPVDSFSKFKYYLSCGV